MVGAPDSKINEYIRTQYEKMQLYYYLAGLWEGDGHIWIPKTTHSPSGKRYTPHFTITFDIRDYPLCLALQKIIGGVVVKKKDQNACTLTVPSKPGLIFIVSIISGKLRTPKNKVFNDLIHWMNVNWDMNIPMSVLDTSDILSNAWLSGFIDADGSFDINIRLKPIHKKNRVEARFRIEQSINHKITNLSFDTVMLAIANAFHAKCNISKHNNDIHYYIVSTSSKIQVNAIINYIDAFPLFSSKRMNYNDFKKCVIIIKNNEHIATSDYTKFTDLKNQINNKPVHFDWTHLKDLPNY